MNTATFFLNNLAYLSPLELLEAYTYHVERKN